MQELSANMQECIDNCLKCSSICQQTLHHCLGMGEEHVERDHIQALVDCAEICSLSAALMSRSSALHRQYCEVSAAACRICADSCAGFDDEQMKKCLEICETCAASCRAMAGLSQSQSYSHRPDVV